MWQLNAAQRDEIEKLRAALGARLSPHQVVDFARDPKSALHWRFEWNDSVAAEKFRVEQARAIIRVVVTVLPGSEEPIRAYVSLLPDRKSDGGYRAMSAVIMHQTRRRQLLDQALAELDALREKYQQIEALAAVWQEVARVRVELAEQATPRAAATA